MPSGGVVHDTLKVTDGTEKSCESWVTCITLCAYAETVQNKRITANKNRHVGAAFVCPMAAADLCVCPLVADCPLWWLVVVKNCFIMLLFVMFVIVLFSVYNLSISILFKQFKNTLNYSFNFFVEDEGVTKKFSE
jgi:hypothetical protein